MSITFSLSRIFVQNYVPNPRFKSKTSAHLSSNVIRVLLGITWFKILIRLDRDHHY